MIKPNVKCAKCAGSGLVITKRVERTCNCVYRAAFQIAHKKYTHVICSDRWSSRVSSQHGGIHASRPDEEFVADFTLLAKRALAAAEPILWKVFDLHMLKNLPFDTCLRILNVSRGNFFHSVYRVHELVGAIFMDTRPYPIVPLEIYFSNRSEGKVTPFSRRAEPRAFTPVRPPVCPYDADDMMFDDVTECDAETEVEEEPLSEQNPEAALVEEEQLRKEAEPMSLTPGKERTTKPRPRIFTDLVVGGSWSGGILISMPAPAAPVDLPDETIVRAVDAFMDGDGELDDLLNDFDLTA